MSRRIALAALAAASVSVVASPALAGRLSAGLERLAADRAAGRAPLAARAPSFASPDEFTVLVVLADAVPLAELDHDLRLARASREERHRAVVQSLRDAAARSQQPLLADLEARRSTGTVRAYAPYWIVNAVAVAAPLDVVRSLAAREDVDVVEPLFPVEPILPADVASGRAGSGASSRGVGITPGLLAIEADRVWNELGIDGTGALVGNMDSGVDGAHPALAARWRGQIAPAAECWRDGADFGDATPVDRHFHGTHVMGTICGLALQDTVGVAPGALWIADNSINQAVGGPFDDDVLAGLQWFADPDGNASTIEDVPDVVQHSWGLNENVAGYVDCDARWWTAIDACEAAGVALVWSAGNDGPGAASVRSPADRAATALNAFAVGATALASPFTISNLSSRGPSGCGGAFEIKPEVVAPGELVYSAEPGGGYRTLSGTSMAGPHVAGIIALMRSANPDLEVDAIKQILVETAIDLGDAGEDNTYGHGFVNAYDAVVAALEGFGRVEGTVRDLASSDPVPGALVDIAGDPRSTKADANGFFRIALQPGSWTLDVGAFGYTTDSPLVEVFADSTVVADVALALAPTALVSGVVRDFASAAVESATVRVLGTPLAPAVTLADGSYSILVPDAASYSLRARRDGFGSETSLVAVAGPTAQDFTLPALTGEDFESGDFEVWPWEADGDEPWTIDASAPHEGDFAARSGAIGPGETSAMELTVTFVEAGTISFWIRTSSQTPFDMLRFSIDEMQVASWSGLVAWKQVEFPVTLGAHTLRWSYTKDGAVNAGLDAAWIDFVEFPPLGTPDYPAVLVEPAALSEALAPNETASAFLAVTNTGVVPLTFTATVQHPGAVALGAPREIPDDGDGAPVDGATLPSKGAADPRPGSAAARGSGGPDLFGYRWRDSDDPEGPVYDWVEIRDVGTRLTMADDTYTPPRLLGFFFPFYDEHYSTVRISANGFVSFSSPLGLYHLNTTIPDSVVLPHGFVAAYWDDLTGIDGGDVYAYQDVANSRYIIEWDGIPLFGSNGTQPQTFQIILNANGTILAQYKSVTNATGCSVGIESPDGTDGLQVAFNAAYLHNGLAIRYSPAPPVSWLSVAPAFGTVPPDSSVSLEVSYDALGLADGTYHAVVRVVTNDPTDPVVPVPVTLVVSDPTNADSFTGLPREFALAAPEPNPFSGATSIRYAVPMQGHHVRVAVYDVGGRLVRSLVDGPQKAGRHALVWDGRDAAGRRVGSGMYFYRMEAGPFSQVRKGIRLQ